MAALSQEDREHIRSRVREQIARQPPPSQASIDEIAAIIASIRIRWAREAAARKAGLAVNTRPSGNRDGVA
jgi:hypothetical protein